MRDTLQGMQKALVPAVVAVLMALLNQFGVTADTTVEQAAVLVITAVVVYYVPNKK